MAIQISGVNVISNSRSLENVGSGSTTITTLRSGITTTAVSKTLVNREYCEVVGAGVTVTLPANPSTGWEVSVGVGTFTNTVVARNGSNIMGLAENMTIDVANVNIMFNYVNSTIGWRAI